MTTIQSVKEDPDDPLNLKFILTVNGNVGQAGSNTAANASFAGNLSFAAQAAAVPEPATWGLMVLGFGMIGSAARSRKTKTSVKFA